MCLAFLSISILYFSPTISWLTGRDRWRPDSCSCLEIQVPSIHNHLQQETCMDLRSWEERRLCLEGVYGSILAVFGVAHHLAHILLAITQPWNNSFTITGLGNTILFYALVLLSAQEDDTHGDWWASGFSDQQVYSLRGHVVNFSNFLFIYFVM